MTVEMLRYQIAKYRAMGNGPMCQELTALLHMGNGPMCQELTALLQKKLATAVA